MKTVGVAEAKAKLSELLGQVAHRGERIVVQRRGKPVAALVPIHDLQRAESDARGDWLDSVVGLCADSPDLCDTLDQIVGERQREMPRAAPFPWDADPTRTQSKKTRGKR
jgi:prevent-host-death family protein